MIFVRGIIGGKGNACTVNGDRAVREEYLTGKL